MTETALITADSILKMAIAYDVEPSFVKDFGETEYAEACSLIQSLWRGMDAIWRRDFGEPVPQMPTIIPGMGSDQSPSTEDQVHNALRTVLVWCYTRIAPPIPCIAIWRFHDAPIEYRVLSTNGGDKDWIAFIPDELEGEYIGWLEQGTSFGCCDVSEYHVPGGKIRIGSHA